MFPRALGLWNKLLWLELFCHKKLTLSAFFCIFSPWWYHPSSASSKDIELITTYFTHTWCAEFCWVLLFELQRCVNKFSTSFSLRNLFVCSHLCEWKPGDTRRQSPVPLAWTACQKVYIWHKGTRANCTLCSSHKARLGTENDCNRTSAQSMSCPSHREPRLLPASSHLCTGESFEQLQLRHWSC